MARLSEPDEHQHQVSLIQWCSMRIGKYPELKYIYAVPNGGQRNKAVARKLKAEGVRAGVLDLALDVPRRGYHGWRFELKAFKNKPTAKQKEEIEFLKSQGFYATWGKGWRAAMESLKWYLDGEPTQVVNRDE